MTAWTTKQVMEALGYADPETVYKLAREGKIRGNRSSRRGPWRFDPQSVERFLSGATASASPASVSSRPQRTVDLSRLLCGVRRAVR